MLQVNVYDLICTNIDGDLDCTARVDFTVEDALKFVEQLSNELADTRFDKACQQFFNMLCSD